MRYFLGFVVFSLAIGAIFYISSCNIKRSAIKTYNRYAANAPYDVIIVPGLPYDSSKTDILLKVRILWAKHLYEKGITKNIIFSGAAVHTHWVEAKVMKTIADSLGIPAVNIFVEDRAEHSNENIYYGYKLAMQLGFKKIALATDPYQCFFLKSYIEKNTPDLAQLPASVDSFLHYDSIGLPQINASDALVANFIPLEKRESRWERLRASFSDDVKEK